MRGGIDWATKDTSGRAARDRRVERVSLLQGNTFIVV